MQLRPGPIRQSARRVMNLLGRLKRLAIRSAWKVIPPKLFRALIEWHMRRTTRYPHTFNERIRYKMAYDRRPILTSIANKVAVKEFIGNVLGPGHVARTLATASNIAEIDWSLLPHEFVIKVNHGCGGSLIVTEDAPEASRLPADFSTGSWCSFRVQPQHADRQRITEVFSRWLSLDYSYVPGRSFIEWCYADIPRQILVEELLRDHRHKHPVEYRVSVIGGEVAFLQVELDVWGKNLTAVMSPQWDLLPVSFVRPPPAHHPPRPRNLKAMLLAAKGLAEPLIDFVRVDIYDLGDRIVVGELTNYPVAGLAPISSSDYANLWGRGWPEIYGPSA
jgi:hypothetical protein